MARSKTCVNVNKCNFDVYVIKQTPEELDYMGGQGARNGGGVRGGARGGARGGMRGGGGGGRGGLLGPDPRRNGGGGRLEDLSYLMHDFISISNTKRSVLFAKKRDSNLHLVFIIYMSKEF